MFDLSDKVVLIIGVGQEVGYRIACVLAKFGATIIACDENKKKAEHACENIFRCGGIGVPVSFDVTDEQATTATLKGITDKLGEVDILIYNAGTRAPSELLSLESFLLTRKEEWANLIEVHLSGFLNCYHAVLGPMVSKKWGRIIKINSNSEGVNQNGTYYDAGEFIATGFVKQLAKETSANGVTCNAITLEWTTHPSSENIPRHRMCSMTRLGTPHDPGYLSLYLSTDAAAWISGQTIPLEIIY